MKANSKWPNGVVMAVFCICSVFSKIDLVRAYNQIPILPDDIQTTAVQQTVIPAVHQEALVGQEVGSNERVDYVGQHQPSHELSAQTLVEADGQPSVVGDGCAVGRTEIVIYALPTLWD
jgi:hypothetical protein